jgi:hypothetical protein
MVGDSLSNVIRYVLIYPTRSYVRSDMYECMMYRLLTQDKDGLSQLSKAEPRHKEILGHMMWAVGNSICNCGACI